MTQDPYKTPTAPLSAEEPVLRERDYLKAYVCFQLCALVVGAIAGGALGALIGGVVGATTGGGISSTVQNVVIVASGLAGIIANYFVFRVMVRHFVVARVASEKQRAA